MTAVGWGEFAREAPELAAAVRARFEAARHHVIATLRSDGSPRVSGTEVDFQDGDLILGSMYGAVKARDLQRDGRFALHANPGDGSMAGGDAKVAGVAEEVVGEDVDRNAGESNPSTPFHLFRLRVAEAVLTSLHPDGDRLVIESWRPGEGVVRRERT
ncbi:MAG TPA: pyridoxamine 5'-phosphate oxidase family protein [Acidimicrobiales bacterium]|nr:pyridoxamine 5'-phosphate oxidase family protein [Acidimicrobiales bacterium]